MREFGAVRPVSKQQIEDFLLAVRLNDDAVDGSRPLELTCGVRSQLIGRCCLESAIDLAQSFCALRWTYPEAGAGAWAGACAVDEAFFVQPASSGCLAGWRRVIADGGPSIAPAWWTAFLTGDDGLDRPDEHAPPSFLDLLLALTGGSQLQLHVRRPSELATVELLRAEIESLHEQLRHLASERRAILDSLSAAAVPTPGLVPQAPALHELAKLPRWAAENEDRIVLLGRALQAARKSVYTRPEAIFAALEILAGPYRDARIGTGTRKCLDDALRHARLGLSRAGGEGTLASEDGYSVKWCGERLVLDQHITKGGGFDPRYILRVYFAWDRQSDRAIVGWLPSHLPTSLS